MNTEHLTIEFPDGAIGHLLYNECTYATDLPVEGQFSQGDGWDFSGFVRAGGWTRSPGSIHVYGTTGSLRLFHYANLLFHFGAEGIRQIPLVEKPSPAHFAAQMNFLMRTFSSTVPLRRQRKQEQAHWPYFAPHIHPPGMLKRRLYHLETRCALRPRGCTLARGIHRCEVE